MHLYQVKYELGIHDIISKRVVARNLQDGSDYSLLIHLG